MHTTETKASPEPWGSGTMTVLVIASIFIPLIGLIAGAVGLARPVTRGQGCAGGGADCLGYHLCHCEPDALERSRLL